MEDEIKIAGLVEESIVDGPGIRFVIFTQGCPHNCYGCHNPQTHDMSLGKCEKIDKIVEKIDSNPLLKGITLSGGEPFLQSKKLVNLISKINNKNLDVVTYTGFTYEELIEKASEDNGYLELLKNTDYLVDGRFEIDKKDEKLLFRGSSNQRIIDVKKSLLNNKVIICDF